jgi:hypothetical protein
MDSRRRKGIGLSASSVADSAYIEVVVIIDGEDLVL